MTTRRRRAMSAQANAMRAARADLVGCTTCRARRRPGIRSDARRASHMRSAPRRAGHRVDGSSSSRARPPPIRADRRARWRRAGNVGPDERGMPDCSSRLALLGVQSRPHARDATERPRHLNADSSNAAGCLEVICTDVRSRTRQAGLAPARPTRKGPARGTFSMGDTGLEPVTSALSRRRSPS